MTNTIGRKYKYEGNHISILIHYGKITWTVFRFSVDTRNLSIYARN